MPDLIELDISEDRRSVVVVDLIELGISEDRLSGVVVDLIELDISEVRLFCFDNALDAFKLTLTLVQRLPACTVSDEVLSSLMTLLMRSRSFGHFSVMSVASL